MVAGISKMLAIPCFVTYNYLFPIIFIPLMLYMVQKVIVIGKMFFSGISTISFIDYIVLAGVVCGFATKQQQANLGCNIYVALFNSESCLFAVVLLFFYFFVIDIGYKNLKGFDNFNFYILIPAFILILSFSKISFGFVFALGASYYVFRNYLLKDKRWFLFIGYCGVFFFYYFLVSFFSNSFFEPQPEINRGIPLFHYVRTECKNLFYIFLHYLFLFFPIVLTGFLNKPKDLKRKEFLEMALLLLTGSCLPGIFMNIHGSSAFYFVIPVYIFSWFLFICHDVLSALIKKHIRIGHVCFALLTIVVVLTCGRNMKILNSISQTFQARISTEHIQKDKDYLLFNRIRNDISKNRKEFCTFLSADSEMIKNYDKVLKESSPKVYLCRPYLAVSAYLGLPVINSMYENNQRFYRGDDKEYGKYNDFASYYLPPAVCGEKVTEENMMSKAKDLNKNNILLIKNDSYELISVQ